MWELNSFIFTRVPVASPPNTVPTREMECQAGGEKKMAAKEICLFRGGLTFFFDASQFAACSEFLSSLTSLSCKYFSISSSAACLPLPLQRLPLIPLVRTQMHA